MLRLAERHRVPRKDFLDRYVGHETEEGWINTVSGADRKWAAFAAEEGAAVERIRAETGEIASATGMSLTEFRAANMVNILVHDLGYQAFRQDEATYPRPHDFLPSLTQPVAFFVGELDNQTPAYQTEAIEMANEAVWHKQNLFFDYFPGLGHRLDKRSRYEDIVFRHAEPPTLVKVAARLAKVLKKP